MAPCKSTMIRPTPTPSSSITSHFALYVSKVESVGPATNIGTVIPRHTGSNNSVGCSNSTTTSSSHHARAQQQKLIAPPQLRSKRRTVAFAVNHEKIKTSHQPLKSNVSTPDFLVPARAVSCEKTTSSNFATSVPHVVANTKNSKTLNHDLSTSQNSTCRTDGARESSPKTSAQRTDVEQLQEDPNNNTTTNNKKKIVDDDHPLPTVTTTATEATTRATQEDSSNSNDLPIKTTTTDNHNDAENKKTQGGGLVVDVNTISTLLDASGDARNDCRHGPVPVSPANNDEQQLIAALLPPTIPFPLKKRKRGRPSKADKLLMIAAQAAIAKATAAASQALGSAAVSVPSKKGRRVSKAAAKSVVPSPVPALPPPPPPPKAHRVKYDMEAVPMVQLNRSMWENFRNQDSSPLPSSASLVSLPKPILSSSSSEGQTHEDDPFMKDTVLWIPSSRKDWEDSISEMKSVCTSAAYRRWCEEQDHQLMQMQVNNSNHKNDDTHNNNNSNSTVNNTTKINLSTMIIPTTTTTNSSTSNSTPVPSSNSKAIAKATAAVSTPTTGLSSSENAAAAKATAIAAIFQPPLQQSFIKDRIRYDDPLRGYQLRHTEGGWLQGFIIYTTMSIWVEDFQWNSRHPQCGLSDDKSSLLDHDATLASGLSALHCSAPDPVDGGIVLHGVAEVSLLGGLGCGELLLRKAIDDILRTNTTIDGDERHGKYKYVVMQATEGSRPFYEKYGFKRVGALCRYKWAGYNKRGKNGTYINTKNGSAVNSKGINMTLAAATTNKKKKASKKAPPVPVPDAAASSSSIPSTEPVIASLPNKIIADHETVAVTTKIAPPSSSTPSSSSSSSSPPPPVGEMQGYRHWTYTNESAKSLDLHGGPSVMMCLNLDDECLLSTPFASSVINVNNKISNNNSNARTTTNVSALLEPFVVKDKPMIQSLGNVNNTNVEDLVPTRKSSRRCSSIDCNNNVVDLLTTTTTPSPTGTSIIGGRRISNRSKRCSSTLSSSDYVMYGQKNTSSTNPKQRQVMITTPTNSDIKVCGGGGSSSCSKKRPRHTHEVSVDQPIVVDAPQSMNTQHSSSSPSAGVVVDAVKSAVSSLLTALSPSTASSAMALLNTCSDRKMIDVAQLKRDGNGRFISPAHRSKMNRDTDGKTTTTTNPAFASSSRHSYDCTKENIAGPHTTDDRPHRSSNLSVVYNENSLPSPSTTMSSDTATKKTNKKKKKYRYPTTLPTRTSSRTIKACDILSVSSHSTKTYSSEVMNNMKRTRKPDYDDQDHEEDSCSKKKPKIEASHEVLSPSSALLSFQLQASSYLDDDTTDEGRRYSKRKSQLLVPIDKMKLCKQKMKSYPRSRIHYYNKIVFRKRSSIINSIIMDNDNNNKMMLDDTSSTNDANSSSSWFTQRAYNGGTMVDHRYEYCYYFVLHYDELSSKVTLVPMIRNGLFTSGKYKSTKLGPRYRYQCNVLDTNRNWLIDVSSDDYEVVNTAIMIMKTPLVASEAWDIYDNDHVEETERSGINVDATEIVAATAEATTM